MFSGLTALEHLSIYEEYYRSPDHLYDSISECCPKLNSLELVGKLDPLNLVRLYAPVFENVRKLTLGEIKPGISSAHIARILDNFAPQLEKLMFKGEHAQSKDIYIARVGLQRTQGFFKDSYGSLRLAELIVR